MENGEIIQLICRKEENNWKNTGDLLDSWKVIWMVMWGENICTAMIYSEPDENIAFQNICIL